MEGVEVMIAGTAAPSAAGNCQDAGSEVSA